MRCTRALLLLALGACQRAPAPAAAGLAGGDVERGKAALRSYGCGSCHQVPGVAQAVGQVGPPLDHVASRAYLHGQEPNTPEAMVRWIQHPQQREPGNAMPDLHVTDHDARDIAAYLYTLK